MTGFRPIVFSSDRETWATPRRFFAVLDDEFGFTLDACAIPQNATCQKFFTPDDDALSQCWSGVVWMNPPYGYGIGKWVAKALSEAKGGATVVALIPARTDTAWWNDLVMKAAEIRFVRGRMRFVGAREYAPFPSAVVVFRPGAHLPKFSVINRVNDTDSIGEKS